MKKSFKGIITALILFMMVFAVAMPVFAAGDTDASAVDASVAVAAAEEEDTEDSTTGDKAIAAAITVGLAAAAGAIGMGWAIAKSSEAISRQPEAEGKIRTSLMLGLVFVETAIIYALVVAILIIFVL